VKKELADDGWVGAPGKFQSFCPVGHAKEVRKHTREGLLTGATGVNQRSIDIEKDKANHGVPAADH
jgi:hypothetical protein